LPLGIYDRNSDKKGEPQAWAISYPHLLTIKEKKIKYESDGYL